MWLKFFFGEAANRREAILNLNALVSDWAFASCFIPFPHTHRTIACNGIQKLTVPRCTLTCDLVYRWHRWSAFIFSCGCLANVQSSSFFVFAAYSQAIAFISMVLHSVSPIQFKKLILTVYVLLRAFIERTFNCNCMR